MPIFEYKAYSSGGATKTGVIDADTPKEPGQSSAVTRTYDKAARLTKVERGTRKVLENCYDGNTSSVCVFGSNEGGLRKYGLDKPARTVKLTLADGGYKILEIGGPAGEKKYHAREASSPLVAVIPSAIVDDLAKGMKELRAKRVADVATFDVEGVELAGENARTLARATSKDAAGVEQQSWKKTAPEAKDLERSKVEDALFKLTGLEVQEFLDKPQPASAYGLDAPVAKVTLKLSGGKPAVTLEFSRKDGAYYSRRPGDDAVLKLDAAKVEEALKALAEL